MFDCASMPVAMFHVHARLRPVDDVKIIPMPEGATVTDVLRALGIPADHWQFAYVQIGDQPILPNMWNRVRPKSGARVFVKVTPGISGAIALFAAIAGAAATSAITGATIAGITISAAVASVAGAIVSGVITFALSSIFAPSKPNRARLTNEAESQTFSITSARNQARPFGVIPEVVGQHRMVPPYAAVPYTEISGNDQYLRFVVLWGYGPVDVTEVKIGNTPIEEFNDVLIENDFNGNLGGLTLYPTDASQDDLAITLGTDSSSRTTLQSADEIIIDVTFPKGLYRLTSWGAREEASVRIIGEYRRVGDAAWSFWFNELITSKQTNVQRFTRRASNLDPALYEVRLSRSEPVTDTAIRKDTATWTALRSFRNTNPVGLTGIAKSAYRIRATDQLNGVVDQLNAVVGVKVPTWDGAAWTGESVSRNPAAIYRRVLTSAANKRARTAAQIDDAGLGEWYEYCESKGLYYDRVFDDESTVRDRLQDIAAAGFASPRLVDGKWGVVIDKPKSVIAQHFTPRNSSNFQGQIVASEIPHAYRIRFPNREKGYIEDERVVYDDGYDETNATEFVVLDAPGKTDPADVYQWGRRILAQARLRPEIFTFDVDIEHLVAERGDLIRFTHDVPKIGLVSGRVKSIDGNNITLDEPVTFEDGKTYTFRFRGVGGATVTQSVTQSAGVYSSVTVSDATGIAANNLFMFGETGSESDTLIIRAIEPNDDLGATIEAVPYRDAIYDAANTIPPYESAISTPSSASFIGPPAPRISHLVSDEDAMTITSEGALVPGIIVHIQAGAASSALNAAVTETARFQARFRQNIDGASYVYVENVSPNASTILLQPVVSGLGYNVEVRAVGPSGEVSAWTKASNHQVAGFFAPPPEIETLGVNALGDQAHLEWTYESIPIDCVGFEVRYSPDQDVTNWSQMTAITDSVPRNARSIAVPMRAGSYAVKPFDANGTRSETALYVNSSLEDPRNLNAILTIAEAPSFSGSKTNLIVSSSVLTLDTSDTIDTWTTLEDVVTLSQGLYQTDQPEGVYDFGVTDLGAVYTTRITADMIVGAFNSDNNMATWAALSEIADLSGGVTGDEYHIHLFVSYSLTDSVSSIQWSDYRKFIAGDYTARHLRFRLFVSSRYFTIIPQISRLTVKIDAPDRLIGGQDIESGTGGKSVIFSPAFHTIQSISIAGEDLESGDYMSVTNKSRTGFTVEFFNSSDVSVDRSFDYQALGFGYERGT